MVAGVATATWSCGNGHGPQRQHNLGRGKEKGGHREVRKLTEITLEGSVEVGEVEDGRKRARRRRTATEGTAKFVALQASLQVRVSEDGEGSRAQLRSCSPELGVARSSGNRRRPLEARVRVLGKTEMNRRLGFPGAAENAFIRRREAVASILAQP